MRLSTRLTLLIKLAGNLEKPPVCGRRRGGRGRALLARANSAIAPLATLAIAIGLGGCASKPQNQKIPAFCGGRRQGLKLALLVLAIVPLAAVLAGCASKPLTIKEAVYIDKPCDRAVDFAPAQWLPIRWINIVIDGVDYVATPDGLILLGNLERLKK
jgi:hypothetical protein